MLSGRKELSPSTFPSSLNVNLLGSPCMVVVLVSFLLKEMEHKVEDWDAESIICWFRLRLLLCLCQHEQDEALTQCSVAFCVLFFRVTG